MSFIQRELDRIAVALREPREGEEYSRLYAAQQALSWAMEPDWFKAPYDAFSGTAQGSEGCRAECDQVAS